MSWWQPVLGALAAAIVAFLGFLGVRFTAKSSRTVIQTVDSATWERKYRYNAERHLRWDLMIVGRLQAVEQKLDIDPGPIEPPPPLFPDPMEGR